VYNAQSGLIEQPVKSRFAPTKKSTAKDAPDPFNALPDVVPAPPITSSQTSDIVKKTMQQHAKEAIEREEEKRARMEQDLIELVEERNEILDRKIAESEKPFVWKPKLSFHYDPEPLTSEPTASSPPSSSSAEKKEEEKQEEEEEVEVLSVSSTYVKENEGSKTAVDPRSVAAVIAQSIKADIKAAKPAKALSKPKKDPLQLQRVTPITFGTPNTDIVQKKLQDLRPSEELEQLAIEQALVLQGIEIPERHWLSRLLQKATNKLIMKNEPIIEIVKVEGGHQISMYDPGEKEKGTVQYVPWKTVIETLTDPLLLTDLAVAFRREGKHKNADDIIQLLMKKFGEDEKLVEEIAATMVVCSTPLDAYPWVRRAFDVSQKKAKRHLYACLEILHQLGNTDRLLETLEEGLINDSMDYYLNLKAAEVHGELGNLNTQMIHMKRIKIPPRLDSPEPHLIYADLLYNVAMKEECEAVLKLVIREYPLCSPLPYIKLALLRLEAMDEAGAKQYENQAVMAVEIERRAYVSWLKKQYKDMKKREAAGEKVEQMNMPAIDSIPTSEMLVSQKLEELKAISNSPIYTDEKQPPPAKERVSYDEKVWTRRMTGGK